MCEEKTTTAGSRNLFLTYNPVLTAGNMQRVIGLGGVFFQGQRPGALLSVVRAASRDQTGTRRLENLRAEGVEIDPKQEDYEYGHFALNYGPRGQSHRTFGSLNHSSEGTGQLSRFRVFLQNT